MTIWKKVSSIRYQIIFALVAIVGIYLRMHDLTGTPQGFFTDEAAIGYNAYKILTTGKDEYGVGMPIFFRSYGDYRLPIPIYANVPVIALLGPTDLAVRTTSALWGIAGMVFMWLLLRDILDKNSALFGFLILSISPWHVHMSRWGSEYIYFPTVFTLALWIYFKAYKNPKLIVLAWAIFGLGMYTYYPSIFITPLFLLIALPTFIIANKKLGLRKVILFSSLALTIYLVVLAPMIMAFFDGRLMTRWKSVDTAKISTQEKVRVFSETYLEHFSSSFLFTVGDIGIRGHYILRHSPKGIGQAYLSQIGFFYLGIVGLIAFKVNSQTGVPSSRLPVTGVERSLYERDPSTEFIPRLAEGLGMTIHRPLGRGGSFLKKRISIPMLALLFIYPLSSAITFDTLATRSIIGVIPVTVLTVVGLGTFCKIIGVIAARNKRFSAWGFVFVLLFYLFLSWELVNFYRIYFFEFPTYSYSWDGFQYGYKQAIQLYLEKYSKIYKPLRISHRFNQSEGLMKFFTLTMKCDQCKFLENPIRIYEDENALYVARDEDLKEAKKLYPEYIFEKVDEIKVPNTGEIELYVGYFKKK